MGFPSERRICGTDRQNCSHNVSQKNKRIRCLSEKGSGVHLVRGWQVESFAVVFVVLHAAASWIMQMINVNKTKNKIEGGASLKGKRLIMLHERKARRTANMK